MVKSLAFFQGDIVPIEQAKVSVMTHALHYGTAVFEGIRGNWNKNKNSMYIFRMKEHYERLIQGCKMMMMDIPYDVDDLCNITVDLIQKSGLKEDVYIRPLVYKSEERVANLMLHKLSSDFTLIIVPFGAYIDTDGAINCCTSSWRRMDDTIIPPRVKISGHYVNSILAKTEAVLAGFDEAILLNQDGNVSEGSGENLFLIYKGVLNTPLVADNNLTGITRDCVIKLAKNEFGLEVVERSIRRSELYLADEVFLTGTAAHITPVGSLDSRLIADGNVGKITKNIRDIYLKSIRGDNESYQEWLTEVKV